MLLSSRPLPRRPTIKDIADTVGMHFSTVSRALRGDRRISPETRQRILAVAEELGYVRDPMLDSLIEYRAKTAGTKAPSLRFAVVTTDSAKTRAEQQIEHAVCDAALRRALHLGFDAERYAIASSQEAVRQLGVQLSAEGVLCGVVYVHHGELADYADSFGLRCAALMGSNVSLGIHSVDTDTQQALVLALEKLVSGGHRRIALALAGATIGPTAARFYGDYLSEQRFGSFQPFLLTPFIGSSLSGSEWDAWWDETQPDCLLLKDDQLLEQIVDAGKDIPHELGVVMLDLDRCRTGSRHSGIRHRYRVIGEKSVDEAVNAFRERVLATRELPHRTLIFADWEEGETAFSGDS